MLIYGNHSISDWNTKLKLNKCIYSDGILINDAKKTTDESEINKHTHRESGSLFYQKKSEIYYRFGFNDKNSFFSEVICLERKWWFFCFTNQSADCAFSVTTFKQKNYFCGFLCEYNWFDRETRHFLCGQWRFGEFDGSCNPKSEIWNRGA